MVIESVRSAACYPHPVLSVPCPWCMAKAGTPCYALFKGTWEQQKSSVRHLPHNSRMELAGARWPSDPEPSATGWL